MYQSKLIKIFLASSEELVEERIRFGDFIRNLDNTYEPNGFRIKLVKWEDLSAAYNGKPKQEEYNEQIRDCDMFIALFRTKAGKFTMEEFEVAKKAQKEFNRPILYVFCRHLNTNEYEEPELTCFKDYMSNNLGYYWNKYDSTDSLQLKFVMELLKMVNHPKVGMKVENDVITFGSVYVANMNNLRFAVDNKDYQQFRQRLDQLSNEIAQVRKKLGEKPDDQDYLEDLQNLLNEQNKLQIDFQRHQQLLLDTAIRIAQWQGEQITDRMSRAMDAFEMGNVHQANLILDKSERDAEKNFIDYRNTKKVTEQIRQNNISSIEELTMKIRTMMLDNSIDIDIRISQVNNLYAQADKMAEAVDYDKEKYARLLFNYAKFLYEYGHYKESLEIGQRQVFLSEEVYGENHPYTAVSYNNIGYCYSNQGRYSMALKYYFKALKIKEEAFGADHVIIAETYNNIGSVYFEKGDYSKALEYHLKALEVWKNEFGENHPNTAVSYNHIAGIYQIKGDLSKSLEYYSKALTIRDSLLGENHPQTATSYNNVGTIYFEKHDYSKAMEYFVKALNIRIKVLGKDHHDVSTSYNNIGSVYFKQGDFSKALGCFSNALKIQEKVFGPYHVSVATSMNNIGNIYFDQHNYSKALEYFVKSLEIKEDVLGKEHLDTARAYNWVALTYDHMGNNPQKALDYYNQTLKIIEKIQGDGHSSTAGIYFSMGIQSFCLKDYPEALEYFNKSLTIARKHNKDNDVSVTEPQKWIVHTKNQMKCSNKSSSKKSFWQRLKG